VEIITYDSLDNLLKTQHIAHGQGTLCAASRSTSVIWIFILLFYPPPAVFHRFSVLCCSRRDNRGSFLNTTILGVGKKSLKMIFGFRSVLVTYRRLGGSIRDLHFLILDPRIFRSLGFGHVLYARLWDRHYFGRESARGRGG
jgi:hypothetical protein